MAPPKKSAVGGKKIEEKSANNESTDKQSRRSVNKTPPAKQTTPNQSKSAKTKATKEDMDTPVTANTKHTDTPIPSTEVVSRRSSRRSTHLLVTPVPLAMSPSRKESKRVSLSTNTSSTPTKKSSQGSTNTEQSKLLKPSGKDVTKLLDTPKKVLPQLGKLTKQLGSSANDVSESPLTQAPQTPTRRTRRLSTDVSDVPELQTPTRRSRRLSTDLSDVPEVHTPTRRSRRLSTDLSDVPEIQTPTRRLRRLSTDLSDVPEVQTPTRRSRRLSTDLSDVPEVQTPTRRSRRLSSSDLDTVDESTQAKRSKLLPANDKLNIISSGRRSRRLSGASLTDSIAEVPMEVLEEEEEEEKNDDVTLLPTASKSEVLEVIIESDNEDDIKAIASKTPSPSKSPSKQRKTGSLSKSPVKQSKEIDDVTFIDITEENHETVIAKSPVTKAKTTVSSPNVVSTISPVNKSTKSNLSSPKSLSLRLSLDSLDDIATSESKLTGLATSGNNVSETPVSVASAVVSSTDTPVAPEVVSSTKTPVAPAVVSSTEKPVAPAVVSSTEKPVAPEVVSSTETPVAAAVVSSTKSTSTTDATPQQKNTDEKKVSSLNNNTLTTTTNLVGVRGLPVSGRWWKDERKRFNSINKDQGPKSSWALKMQRKQELKDVLTLRTSIVEQKKQKKSDHRERQRINTIRREENARKSEIVQVIKDSRKIKKMKRKQLRFIETRDTSLLKKV